MNTSEDNGMELWSSADRVRWFLIPDNIEPTTGSVRIQGLSGKSVEVDQLWLKAFEISEDQARKWAKEQFGQALGEIRGAVDEKLADWRGWLDNFNQTPVTEDMTVTPNAPSVLLDLLKQFPGVLGKSLSGDEPRVGEARNAMVELQRQLKEAGIDLDDRFTNFPDRLDDLRRNAEKELAAKRSTKNKQSSEQR